MWSWVMGGHIRKENMEGGREGGRVLDSPIGPSLISPRVCLAPHLVRLRSCCPSLCARRQWRARQPQNPRGQLRLYCSIFGEVVRSVQVSSHHHPPSLTHHSHTHSTCPSVVATLFALVCLALCSSVLPCKGPHVASNAPPGHSSPDPHPAAHTCAPIPARPSPPRFALLQTLLNANVVHFDLKCDNVLLDPAPAASAEDFWRPPSAHLPFRVVLADFGESKLFK
jgi:hypothetical protein